MKRKIRVTVRILFMLCILLTVILISKTSFAATDQFTDGIFTYTISDKDAKTVTLIKCTPDYNATYVKIPSEAKFNGTTYKVTSVGGPGLDVFYHDDEKLYKVRKIEFQGSLTGTVTNFDSYLPELTTLVFNGDTPPSKIETTSLNTVINVPSGKEEAYQKVIHAIYEYSRSGLYETTYELQPNVVALGVNQVESNYFIKDKLIYQVIEKAGTNVGKVKLLGNHVRVGQAFLEIPSTVTYNDYTYRVTELGKISLCGAKVKWIFIPNTVTTIDSSLFDDNVTHIFLSKNIKTIPSNLFTGENNEFLLKFLYMPEGITNISKSAFGNGTFDKVNSLIVPTTIKTIEENALASIKTLVFMNNKPISNLYKGLGVNSKAFRYGNSDAKSKVIKVTSVSKGVYQKALKNYIGKTTVTAKKDVIKATKLTVSQSSIQVTKGNKKQINAVLSSKKANEVVQWNSADTRIATVSKSGTVTGVSKGTTYVLAYTQTSGLYKIIKIVVK